jgi:hypothetical protein
MNSLRIRRKQYLSGIDWFVRALDERTRDATGSGNFSQVVLALKGALDHEALRKRLTALLTANPVFAGRCRRCLFNLAPYWRMERTPLPEDVRLNVRRLPGPLSVDDVLHELSCGDGRWLDEPLRVAVTVVPHGERTYVSMRFDHQILDAVGAERLLLHLSESDDPARPLPLGDRSAELNKWVDKFKSGQVVNREILSLRGDQPPSAIPLPAYKRREHSRTRFVIRAYSPSETAGIGERAERCAGYLFMAPYLLGLAVGALHGTCQRLGVTGGDYVIPVTVDSRPPDSGSSSILFNHLSFNFYRFDRATANDYTALWESAARQLYSQVEKRMAQHVANAGLLLRIVPASLLGRIMTLPLKGRLGSMSFAFVGRGGYGSERFMGVPVENAYHLPRVPTPPGLGLFFTRYRDRLTMVFSYLEGMLDEASASRFVNQIDSRLKGAG